VLGSLGARYAGFLDEGNGLTTPAPVELHRALRGLGDAGADTVIMEVTSHALRMRRIDGLTFSGGLLAAIRGGEHTDFHRTFDDYLDAKRLFLDYLSPDATLAYDADDRGARELAAARAMGRSVGFSLDGRPADLSFSEVRLDGAGSQFWIDGPLAAGRRHVSSALLGSGHLRNVALALTYALASGVEPAAAANVLGTLRPLPRRMEPYGVAGRTVLDDTAAHPDSFRAAFAVARLLPHERMVVVYAVRGNRGADINARNAEALGDLAAEYLADAVLLTASSDTVAVTDRVSPQELDAARAALSKRGRAFVVHRTLREAVAQALDRTRPGDLILLIGAQGMNQGKQLLLSSAGTASRT
jgi:UDP-N-acetylmuramoyl-L-alanyl-D-glutamate--2,6-diaminopimelate ligase